MNNRKKMLKNLSKWLRFRKFTLTTYHDNVKHIFSKYFYLYIYAAGGTPEREHDTWLSHACASGSSFLLTSKDNHK